MLNRWEYDFSLLITLPSSSVWAAEVPQTHVRINRASVGKLVMFKSTSHSPPPSGSPDGRVRERWGHPPKVYMGEGE